MWSTILPCWHSQSKMQRLNSPPHLQMFSRKYQRIAADYGAKGALFLEILGDETPETRVSQPDCQNTLPALGLMVKFLEGMQAAGQKQPFLNPSLI